MASTKLQIREGDLKGDCFRLNQRFDLNEARLVVLESGASGPSNTGTGAASIAGLHAARLSDYAPSTHLFALFVEVDRNNLIYQSQYIARVPTWVYVSGVFKRTQAQLAALAATLGTADVGLRVEVTDYAHLLRWTGTVWQWDPADDQRAGEGPIFRKSDPSPTTGWHLYDGTANVPYLKSDGSTGTETLDDLTTPVVMMAGLANAGPTAAVAPTENVGASTLAIVNASTGASIPANTGAPSGTTVVQSGTGATVASSIHTHSEGSLSDPTHTHALTGSVVMNADGTQRSLTRKAWFRQ